MILSRAIEHMKQQHWTGVFIELVIVVLGVFIGLQVDNWNTARVEGASAAEFHRRLLVDLRLEAINYANLESYFVDVRKAAETAYKGFAGESQPSDSDLLVSAFRASQYNFMERHRATYDELVGSGNLDLIRDAHLRTLVAGYYGMSLLQDTEKDIRQSPYRRLFRETVRPELQLALTAQCGDKQIETASVGQLTLNYPCKLKWPPEKIAAAVAAMRSNKNLLPLLGLRIVNLESDNFALRLNYTAYDLDSFRKN